MQDRLAQARAHFSHPSAIFGNWVPLGPEYPLLNEYLTATAVTIMFALLYYFVVSTLLYLIYNIWYKKKFTPRQEELRYEPETFYHDIKWSVLNILGQAPLVSLIKLGYPYYSKIQYEFHFTPIVLLYLFFHIVYDEFLTYWAHRLLHHPTIYRYLHAVHHKSKAVTPFTGFAFHPLDAFIQAVPVFTSCYFIPIHINIVLAHGMLTSLWAFSIHDNVNMVPFKGILYAGSHSIHHYPWGENYNYGKFTSICDRLYGSYCDPEAITGYGYTPPAPWLNFIQHLNIIFTTLVPDRGVRIVGKIRQLYSKKIE